MAKSAQMVYEATCELTYRYTCEKCKHTTDNFTYTLKQYASHTHQGGNKFQLNLDLDITALDKAQDKAIQRLDMIKKMMTDMKAHPNIIIEKFPFFPEIYDDALSMGKKCPKCGAGQSWYPASRFIPNSFPAITFGPDAVKLQGLDESEFLPEDDTDVFPVHTIVVNKYKEDLNQLVYQKLLENQHQNIVRIKRIQEHTLGVYSIDIEDFQGVPLSAKLSVGISEKQFQDIIIEICDALEFLHTQEPPIVYNIPLADNILIDDSNLIKLTNFEHAILNGDVTADVKNLHAFMESVDAKYMKRYTKFLEKSKKYKSIKKFHFEFLPLLKPGYAKIFSVLFVILFAFGMILRRFL